MAHFLTPTPTHPVALIGNSRLILTFYVPSLDLLFNIDSLPRTRGLLVNNQLSKNQYSLYTVTAPHMPCMSTPFHAEHSVI